jgi:hypothetical protein
MHTTDRGLPAERHPCSLLMNAEQLRACRARLQAAAIISDGRDSDASDLGAAGMRAKRSEVLRRLPWWHQNRNTAVSRHALPRARNEMRSGRGRGRCFRASLEANATTKPRSPAALCRVS